MRKTTWFRFGFGSLIAAGASVALFATGCSSNNNTNDAGPTADAGTDAVTPTDGAVKETGTADSALDTNGPKGDSGTDAGTDAGPVPWVTLVNASPDLGPIGLCFSANGATPPLAPNVIPPGAGGGQAFAYPGFDLTTIPIEILGIPAANIPKTGGALDGGVWGCDALTKSDAGTGWMTIGTIAKGQFSNGNVYIAAITGCQGGNSSGKCGAGYTDAGNIGLTTYQVDNTSTFDAGIGVQFLQLSPQWEAFAQSLSAGGYGTTGAAVTFNHLEEAERVSRGELDPFLADASEDAAMDSGPAADAAMDSGAMDSGAMDSGMDATAPADAGMDTSMPADAGMDTSMPADAGTDATMPVDAGTDTGPVTPSDMPIGANTYGKGPTKTANVVGLTNYNPPSDVPGFAVEAMLADGGVVMIPTGLPSPYPPAIPQAFGLSAFPAIQMMSFGPNDAGMPNTPTGGFLTSGNWTFMLLGDFSLAVTQPDGGAASEFGPRIIALPNYAH